MFKWLFKWCFDSEPDLDTKPIIIKNNDCSPVPKRKKSDPIDIPYKKNTHYCCFNRAYSTY